jgi:predicted alpha-1,2-mannosidase
MSEDNFTPFVSGTWPDFFYETNSWELSFYVPHDMPRLIEKCGGVDVFESRLDTFFTHTTPENPSNNIGLFQVTNEPGFLVPTLYNYINRPDKTASIVRQTLATRYNTTREGLPGNDDSGSMSSWYISHALGFYPNAGQDLYLVSSPIFEKVTIHLENGESLIIISKNASAKNIYIQSAIMNGKPLNRCWFKHTDIMNGGVLTFIMGDSPTNWSKDGRIPPSGIDFISRME